MKPQLLDFLILLLRLAFVSELMGVVCLYFQTGDVLTPLTVWRANNMMSTDQIRNIARPKEQHA